LSLLAIVMPIKIFMFSQAEIRMCNK